MVRKYVAKINIEFLQNGPKLSLLRDFVYLQFFIHLYDLPFCSVEELYTFDHTMYE